MHQRREPGPLRQKWPCRKPPRRRPPRCRTMNTDSLLESWSLPALVQGQNVAKVKISGESCMALLNNGMQINTIMPSYVKSQSLEMGRITNLTCGSHLHTSGKCLHLTPRLHYCQGSSGWSQGYNEDQIAPVVPDLSNFAERIPGIIVTPTISCITNVMKERKIDALAKCQGGPSLVSMKDCSHNGRWPNHGGVQPG